MYNLMDKKSRLKETIFLVPCLANPSTTSFVEWEDQEKE